MILPFSLERKEDFISVAQCCAKAKFSPIRKITNFVLKITGNYEGLR